MASGIKDLSGKVGVRDSVQFDPRQILIEPGFNPRSLEELRANIENLKPQILEAGAILQPIWVRRQDDKVYLVDGESRLRAVQELIAEGHQIPSGSDDQPSIPTIYFRGANNDVDRLTLALTANEGRPLVKADLGRAYIRLTDLGWDEARIGKRFGKTELFVRTAMELAEAPAEVQTLVAEGKVTEGAAVAATRKHGNTAAAVLTQRVAASPNGAPVAREKSKGIDNKALRSVAVEILDEADTDDQRDGALKEISRETIQKLRLIVFPNGDSREVA